MKLNLGCGARILDGFVNVDLAGNWSSVAPDVVADITEPLPFEAESADEIHAYHVVEHLYRWQIEDVLRQWLTVLKPGGALILECPCLDKILRLYSAFISSGKEPIHRLTIWGLYGDPAYRSVEMTHKWCYSRGELTAMLEHLGLEVRYEEPQTHRPVRDMRLVGMK